MPVCAIYVSELLEIRNFPGTRIQIDPEDSNGTGKRQETLFDQAARVAISRIPNIARVPRNPAASDKRLIIGLYVSKLEGSAKG
jgi:hypothetical protein